LGSAITAILDHSTSGTIIATNCVTGRVAVLVFGRLFEKPTGSHQVGVEFATLESGPWLDYSRLLEAIGYVPPIEHEAAYHQQLAESAMAA
jgi:hypothetical protein